MRKPKICGIYKIISPSEKIYIGQSSNFNERVTFYRNGHGYAQIKLHRSIKKYGWGNHKCEIICECHENELNEMERYYIKLYDTFNSIHGLNLTEGGGNGKRSNETKARMSKSRIGTKRSLESRQNQSKNRTGKRYTPIKIKVYKVLKGRKHTMTTRAKISFSHLGKKKSETHSQNISLAKKGIKVKPEVIERKKKLILNTLTGIIYFGVKEAAYTINSGTSTLGKKLCGIDKNNTPFLYI